MPEVRTCKHDILCITSRSGFTSTDQSSLHPTTEHALFSSVSGLRMGGAPELAIRSLKRTISVLRICLGDFQ
eukprot:1771865-Amphidinium_carterae.1